MSFDEPFFLYQTRFAGHSSWWKAIGRWHLNFSKLLKYALCYFVPGSFIRVCALCLLLTYDIVPEVLFVGRVFKVDDSNHLLLAADTEVTFFAANCLTYVDIVVPDIICPRVVSFIVLMAAHAL